MTEYVVIFANKIISVSVYYVIVVTEQEKSEIRIIVSMIEKCFLFLIHLQKCSLSPLQNFKMKKMSDILH